MPEMGKSVRMNLLDILKEEHRTVEALFDEVQSCEPDDARIDDLANTIRQELSAHLQLEEKLFYPVLRDRSEEDEERVDVFEAYTEHDVAKHLLDLLRSGRKRDGQFKAELQVLGENVKHHAKEEESTVFSLAHELMDDEELDRLGDKWERAKQRLTVRQPAGRKKSGTRKKSGARKSAARKKASRTKKRSR